MTAAPPPPPPTSIVEVARPRWWRQRRWQALGALGVAGVVAAVVWFPRPQSVLPLTRGDVQNAIATAQAKAAEAPARSVLVYQLTQRRPRVRRHYLRGAEGKNKQKKSKFVLSCLPFGR